MSLLILGLIVWTAAHLFKRVTPEARDRLVARLGDRPARGAIAVAILARAGPDRHRLPRAPRSCRSTTRPPGRIHLNNLLMFFAVALMGAGRSKGRARALLRHPMLTAVLVWAFAHLIVNGDQASLILFGWMAVWALASMALINAREPAWVAPAPGAWSGDLRLLLIAAVLYAVIATIHTLARLLAVPAVTKTRAGRFFEDYRIGQALIHAVPRTVTDGDRALYTALYPTRFALASSDEFARACGLPRSPLDDLAAFHVVFGKTVPDVSLNAVANLGYAEGRFLAPVYPGDTLTAVSEVDRPARDLDRQDRRRLGPHHRLQPERRAGARLLSAG